MNEQLLNAIQALKKNFDCEEKVDRGEHTLFLEGKDIFDASQTYIPTPIGTNVKSSICSASTLKAIPICAAS